VTDRDDGGVFFVDDEPQSPYRVVASGRLGSKPK
jgi:hypothetical protein